MIDCCQFCGRSAYKLKEFEPNMYVYMYIPVCNVSVWIYMIYMEQQHTMLAEIKAVKFPISFANTYVCTKA